MEISSSYKLFGTFQGEEEKPVYGLTHPLKRYSFLWQHFHYFAELAEACKRSGSILDAIKILFGNPELLDQGIRPELERKLLPKKRNPKTTKRFRFYLSVQLFAALVALFIVTYNFTSLTIIQKTFLFSGILLTLINCGAMLEQQRWIYLLEAIRLTLIIGSIAYYQHSILMFVCGTMVIIFAFTLESVYRLYFELVYSIRTLPEKPD